LEILKEGVLYGPWRTVEFNSSNTSLRAYSKYIIWRAFSRDCGDLPAVSPGTGKDIIVDLRRFFTAVDIKICQLCKMPNHEYNMKFRLFISYYFFEIWRNYITLLVALIYYECKWRWLFFAGRSYSYGDLFIIKK